MPKYLLKKSPILEIPGYDYTLISEMRVEIKPAEKL